MHGTSYPTPRTTTTTLLKQDPFCLLRLRTLRALLRSTVMIDLNASASNSASRSSQLITIENYPIFVGDPQTRSSMPNILGGVSWPLIFRLHSALLKYAPFVGA